MSIKGVFFDLMGTLMIYGDMSAEWADFLSEYYICLKRHGLSIPKEAFAERYDRFRAKEEPPEREDGLTIFERHIQAFCADLEVSASVEAIKRIATTILTNALQKHISLDPDCHPVLEALQQHKTLGLISNFDHPPYVNALVRELGLEKFFAAVVVSGDVGIRKPDPRIFHLALQRTGLQPKEVVYVGDAEEDIIGSLAAGIVPILIKRARSDRTGSPLVPAQPNTRSLVGVRTIDSLPQLMDILK